MCLGEFDDIWHFQIVEIILQSLKISTESTFGDFDDFSTRDTSRASFDLPINFSTSN